MTGKTFGINCIPQINLFFNILDSVSHAYTLLCDCRGGSKNEKCSVAIADLVLLYNATQEGLYGPVKNDRSAFDLFALCPGTKKWFVKFCKAHEQRLRLNLHDFRVIRADAAEGDTYINVGGFFAAWTTGNICRQWKQQFLDHRRLCHGYFTAPHGFLNLWFWNIPIQVRLSFNVWPSLVDGDKQLIATHLPAMLWQGSLLHHEYQHSQVDGAAVLLRASLCFALYMARWPACLPSTRPAATPDPSSPSPTPLLKE